MYDSGESSFVLLTTLSEQGREPNIENPEYS